MPKQAPYDPIQIWWSSSSFFWKVCLLCACFDCWTKGGEKNEKRNLIPILIESLTHHSNEDGGEIKTSFFFFPRINYGFASSFDRNFLSSFLFFFSFFLSAPCMVYGEVFIHIVLVAWANWPSSTLELLREWKPIKRILYSLLRFERLCSAELVGYKKKARYFRLCVLWQDFSGSAVVVLAAARGLAVVMWIAEFVDFLKPGNGKKGYSLEKITRLGARSVGSVS